MLSHLETEQYSQIKWEKVNLIWGYNLHNQKEKRGIKIHKIINSY
jgi:hypothetical protein